MNILWTKISAADQAADHATTNTDLESMIFFFYATFSLNVELGKKKA